MAGGPRGHEVDIRHRTMPWTCRAVNLSSICRIVADSPAVYLSTPLLSGRFLASARAERSRDAFGGTWLTSKTPHDSSPSVRLGT